jgi:hypothetical protein
MLHVAMVQERTEAEEASGPGIAARVVLLVGVTSATAAVFLRGPGGSYRTNLLLLLGAFAGLATLIVLEQRRRTLSRGLVIGATGALLAIAVVVPPVQSNDLWLYAAYGRMISHHGTSPYAAPPSRIRDDPLYPRVDRIWRGTRSLYGPGFIAIAAVGTAVTGDSALATRLLFQGLAAAAVLIALLLVDRRTKDPMAWLLVGVNPMVVGVVNGGHNDALVALALLGGVLLAMMRRPVLAGLAVGLGVSVKVVTLLPLAALLVWLWGRQGLRAALVAGGVAVGIVAGAYLLAGGRTAVEPLGKAEQNVSRSSIWNAPRREITFDLVDKGVRGGVAGATASARVTRWAHLAVAALAALLIVPRLRAKSPAVLVGAAALAYLLAGAYVVPWYAVWGLPLLALAPRSWVTGVTLAITATVSLAYVPDPTMTTPDPLRVLTPWQALRFDLFAVWAPLAAWALILVVVVLSGAAIWRRATQNGTEPAMSAMTPK